MDPKQLAEILTKASREAAQKSMTDQQRLHAKVKVAKEAAKIEDAAARMMLAIENEAKITGRASSDGLGSTTSSGGFLKI